MEQGIQHARPSQRVLLTSEPVHLSLVIPAYNEELRLGRTLDAAIAFLARKPYRSELVLVLDGCTDGTPALARRYAGTHGACEIRVIDNAENQGKGACVRQGMLAAGGSYCFFTDADLSYPLHQIDPFLHALVTEGGLAIASRDASAIRYQSPLRRLVTFLSRQLMYRLFVPGVKDTQAGFKGFTQAVAQDLFRVQRVSGFGFDAELLYIAHMRGYRIKPMSVEWEDVPGSKVRLGRDVTRMALDLGRILLNRLFGRYRKQNSDQ
ncbi:MAG: dolichyl-phosphate beta-glucosyltransferase [Candidatus Sericytochromatia bacterium]